ncbi:hypothetical protein [Actinomyces gerencseriae]
MSTAVAPPRDVIKHVAPDELEARRRIIVSELERRFGSLDAALAQEYTGSHPSEDLRLFGAYHDVMLLLGE